jgi:hypothetical protein
MQWTCTNDTCGLFGCGPGLPALQSQLELPWCPMTPCYSGRAWPAATDLHQAPRLPRTVHKAHQRAEDNLQSILRINVQDCNDPRIALARHAHHSQCYLDTSHPLEQAGKGFAKTSRAANLKNGWTRALNNLLGTFWASSRILRTALAGRPLRRREWGDQTRPILRPVQLRV